MAHTYEELHKKTIDQLRDIAKDVQHDAVQGYSQMNKEHLLPALCKALGIEAHSHHEVVGVDKASIKKRLRELKGVRQKALEARDHLQLKQVRREIHHLKRRVRAATV
jgi:DNA-binding IclR family transcriptional regulator